MATVGELREELRIAQGYLKAMSWVDWRRDVNGGMISYSNQLAKCHQLQLRIQRAVQGGG